MEYTEKEEKKAIKDLKSFLKFLEETYITKGKIYLHIEVLVYNRKNLDIILNLLKKQQKEIEELKYKYKKYGKVLFTEDAIKENYVSKNEIREKIKELQNYNNNIDDEMVICTNIMKMQVLDELLKGE